MINILISAIKSLNPSIKLAKWIFKAYKEGELGDIGEAQKPLTQVEMELARTFIRGLYAAGDELFGEISPAAMFGWIAGENATKNAEEAELVHPVKIKDKMQEKGSFFSAIMS